MIKIFWCFAVVFFLTSCGGGAGSNKKKTSHQAGTALNVSFSKNTYFYRESSQSISGKLKITRNDSKAELDAKVILKPQTSLISNLKLDEIDIHFDRGVSEIEIDPSEFILSSDGQLTGDKSLVLSLTSLDSEVEVETSEAALVILDDEIKGSYFFDKSFYSVHKESNEVSLTIIRQGDLSEAGSVAIGFKDGSALSTLDYDNSQIVVNFLPNEESQTLSIPLTQTNETQTNKSFYVYLKSPSNGVIRGSLMATKVRILNKTESLCDETLSPFGGGSGDSSEPYLICSSSQLEEVSNHLDKNFRLESDLSIDENSPLFGNFTGVFDGNEYTLSNFDYIENATKSSPVGFFEKISGINTVVKNLNLINFSLSTTISSNNTSGLIGTLEGEVSELSNIFIAGMIKSGASASAAGLINVMNGKVTSEVKNIFITGEVTGGSSGASGFILSMPVTSSYELETFIRNGLSLATINSSGISGGIFSSFYHENWANAASLKIYSSLASGFIKSTSSNAGGFIGEISSYNLNDTIEFASNEALATVSASSSSAGGFIGRVVLKSDHLLFLNSSSLGGQIAGANSAGGIGSLRLAKSLSFLNIGIDNEITGSDKVGGFIAVIDSDGSDIEIDLENINVKGSISSSEAAYTTGGLLSFVGLSNQDNNSIKILNSSVEADIIGNKHSGGFLGQLNLRNSLKGLSVEGSHFTGALTSEDETGGVVGRLEFLGSDQSFITIKETSIDADISGAWSVAGLIGSTLIMETAANISVDKAEVSGSVVGSGGNIGGFFGSINTYSTGSNGSDIEISSSKNNASVTGDRWVGGAIGAYVCSQMLSQNLNLNRFASLGNVTGTNQVGGLIGTLSIGHSNCHVVIEDSYASGDISGNTIISGLIGYTENADGGSVEISRNYVSSLLSSTVQTSELNGLTLLSGTITQTSSYWLKGSLNPLMSSDGDERSEEELLLESTYVGWDFATVWQSPVSTYPSLK